MRLLSHRVVFNFFLLVIPFTFIITTPVFARVTPEDNYQVRQANYQSQLSRISDPAKKQLIQQADQLLKNTNQKICGSFDTDVNKIAAILDEEKSRQNVTKTVVAYGQGNTPLDTAAYYINYAAEAIAYQKAKDYTPQINGSNLGGSISSSLNNLKSDLKILQSKVLKAKAETKKALDYYNEK